MKYVITFGLTVFAFLFVCGCEESLQSERPQQQDDGKTVIPILPVEKSGKVDWNDVRGRAWVRFTPDGGYDGFYLSPDFKLVLINVPDMYGIKWMINGRMLSFAMQVPGEQDPRIVLYTTEFADGKLLLSYEGSEKPMEYYLAELSDPFDNSQWEIDYLAGSVNTIPEGERVYIQFDPVSGRLAGFSGVNRFSGAFKRIGGSTIEMGAIAATRMAGPGLAFEQEFLSAVQKTDRVLALGETLRLYSDGRLMAIFKKMPADASPVKPE